MKNTKGSEMRRRRCCRHTNQLFLKRRQVDLDVVVVDLGRERNDVDFAYLREQTNGYATNKRWKIIITETFRSPPSRRENPNTTPQTC
ncbi:hypothetical protein QVD17_12769 [Tagetes erecta]|uniref:Uncharacterized protein n=1 Tax=Tagetes erecta TaxID=13708 RepID=A0AAD8NVS2_TARER|nr:hypothetical protein QVD17_12769 [Tagetes erecta]